jgi:hypothetical protein
MFSFPDHLFLQNALEEEVARYSLVVLPRHGWEMKRSLFMGTGFVMGRS